MNSEAATSCILYTVDVPRLAAGLPYTFPFDTRKVDITTSPMVQVFFVVVVVDSHIQRVLSLQLKKLRCHNKSAIDLSNANPACGHKEVRRSTGHIMVTTRYSDQQGSKSRQKVMRLYKQWHRPISKRFIKLPYSMRATSIDSECCRLPTTSVLSKKRKNYAPTSFDQQVQVSQGHTLYRN